MHLSSITFITTLVSTRNFLERGLYALMLRFAPGHMRLAPHGIKGERRLMSSLRAFRRYAHLSIDLRKVHIGLHLLQELDDLCAFNVSK